MTAREIIIQPGLWKGCEVDVQPPTSAHPLRPFPDHGKAAAYAEQLSSAEGWPVIDRHNPQQEQS